jgi:hypothetical protein
VKGSSALQLPKAARETTFHTGKTDHERALHNWKTSERNKKAWSCTEKVWKAHESYTSSKLFLLKNWVHMKSYISFKSKHMYVSRIKNAYHILHIFKDSLSLSCFSYFSIHCKMHQSSNVGEGLASELCIRTSSM